MKSNGTHYWQIARRWQIEWHTRGYRPLFSERVLGRPTPPKVHLGPLGDVVLARMRRITRTPEFEAAVRRHPSTCAICGRLAAQGHDNAAHDAHMASRTVTPVPVDGKPALAPRRPACVVCAYGSLPATRGEIAAHNAHTIADEAARYQRELNTYLAATKGEIA